MEIPILDFGRYQSADSRASLADEIVHTLETVGFLYLKNHGIPSQQIDQADAAAVEYFGQELSVKKQFPRPSVMTENPGTGYCEIGTERLYESSVKEVKETFDFILSDLPEGKAKSAKVLIGPLTNLFNSCAKLTLELFHCIALGLKLPNENYFEDKHRRMGGRDANSTALRVLHYPPFDSAQNEENATRLGAHTDWCSMTILFQRGVGGLEVETADNKFIPAPPIAETVLVNIGDILQFWTCSRLKATTHRVRAVDSEQNSKVRRSIAFFAEPDFDAVVESLDPRYYFKPEPAGEYILNRFRHAYHYQERRDFGFMKPQYVSD
ncbi:hypothetical protein RvY_07025 [Ramazzottius varieornatus]|uniref:Fe2OG dioxygenase domain-containing protein n=1 Tax=Ramazzottius varieornatus TaxID=947166 RepID=A0A1D1V5U9_RAMVA|nr:hypothetical protein RvY_07025 [Ramazzottius varieornatus]